MSNFPIPDNPEFTSELRKLETTDPVHADTFNNDLKVLIENDAALKKDLTDVTAVANSKSTVSFSRSQSSGNAIGSITIDGTKTTLYSPSTMSANEVTSGTFSSTNTTMPTGTDYDTARIRNISAGETDLTAGTSELANGNIYLFYV